MRLAYQFQGQKVNASKVKVTMAINADTHPAAYLPMLVVVVGVGLTFGLFLGHFRINLHQTRTQYSNEGRRHCN